MAKMKAAIFVEPGRIILGEKPLPDVGPTDALIKITTTTICGTDVHILKGEYPVESGLTIGHEPVGTIEKLGSLVSGFSEGDRVIAGAITPCGQCFSCLGGHSAQCGDKPMGVWRFGNTIDGSQAEYLLVPDAIANLTQVPDSLTDAQVLMCPDIMSTGFAGAESGNIQIGDVVAVFAQGPIGLCATAGARLRGASRIIAVETVPERIAMSRQLGVDVSIEALGLQQTFEAALRVLKPGGTLSSLGVYSGELTMPIEAIAAGLGDHKIVTSLCPGGKERMRRLINIVESGRVDLRPLVTHHYTLDDIETAYELFSQQRDGVLKIAITP